MDKINYYFFKTISSTNTYAKENIADLKLPCIIIADEQTAGRGRRGNSFYSPSGSGLYMTALFYAPDDCSLLTPVAAVSVCKALEYYGLNPQIKWVNDIFIDCKKACGILTEIFSYNQKNIIALGVGINLTTREFPENMPQATSIGLNLDKRTLSLKIFDYILDYCKNKKNSQVTDEYQKRLFIIGKQITYTKNNIEYCATVQGINSSCNLIVELSNGNKDVLSSGEISIKF